MAQGAGIQAAETICRLGAGVLLTGYVGPKAFQALSAAGVEVCQDLGRMSVREAVERYCAGQVQTASGPNRRGHWR
jgi:predicted Fe-Mo cluster-binding NifX family protein